MKEIAVIPRVPIYASHFQLAKVGFQILLLSILFFSLLNFIDQAPGVDDQFQLRQAQRLPGISHLPPTDNTNWRSVVLPDDYNPDNPSFPTDMPFTSIWYLFTFNISQFQTRLNPLDNQWAVYITTPYANAAIYLNGAFLGNGGNMEPPIPIYRRPLMFTFPLSLLRENNNELYYHYVRGVKGAYAEPVYIGPISVFEQWHSNTMLMKKDLRMGILTMMAVITCIMSLMFLLRPRDKVFGWYSASTFVWILHYSMRMTDEVPFSNQHLISAYSYLTLGLFALFASQYVGCFVKIRVHWVDRFILIWSVMGGIFLFSIAYWHGNEVNTFGEYIWMPSALIVGCYSVCILIIGYRREPSTDNHLLLVSIGLLLAVGIRDYLFDFANLVPGSTYYLQYGAGMVMAFWTIILMRRFATALETAEVLNNELENRVTEKSKQLKAVYAESSKIEQEHALVEERERIMRDMHDGLGGQLIQVLSMAEQNPELSPVRETLRFAIRDLRLIIDSLSIVDGDLSTVLGIFRYRTEKMIKDVDLSYNWQVNDVPAISQLGPATALQVLRILQEAVSNIMQHANAKTITVRTCLRSQEDSSKTFVIIEIIDDGIGIHTTCNDKSDSLAISRGHGLINMQFRAKKVGGQLTVDGSSEGTIVELWLPITR